MLIENESKLQLHQYLPVDPGSGIIGCSLLMLRLHAQAKCGPN